MSLTFVGTTSNDAFVDVRYGTAPTTRCLPNNSHSKSVWHEQLLQDFTKVLSNSPIINDLYIRIQIVATHPNILLNGNWIYEDEDEPHMVAHTRAAELFLESGILNALRELSNVTRSTIRLMKPSTTKVLVLLPKYDEMLIDLELDIELGPEEATSE